MEHTSSVYSHVQPRDDAALASILLFSLPLRLCTRLQRRLGPADAVSTTHARHWNVCATKVWSIQVRNHFPSFPSSVTCGFGLRHL